MKRSVITRTCCLAIVSAMAAHASAAIVEIAVSGRISVNDPLTLLPDEIHTGEPWTGVIRYDASIADQVVDPKQGYYSDPLRLNGLSIAVEVHGHVFAGGNGELQARVLNDIVHNPDQPFNFFPGDSFSIGGPMRQSPRLLDHSSISFSWNDSAGEALSNDSLPIVIDPFEFIQTGSGSGLPTYSPIYIRIQDIGLSTPTSTILYMIDASIESATVRVIPEPKTFANSILASVLIATFGSTRRVVLCARQFA